MENFTFCAVSIAENGSYIFRKQIKEFEISLKGNYFGKQKHIFIFTFLSHVTVFSVFIEKNVCPKKTNLFILFKNIFFFKNRDIFRNLEHWKTLQRSF